MTIDHSCVLAPTRYSPGWSRMPLFRTRCSGFEVATANPGNSQRNFKSKSRTTNISLLVSLLVPKFA